MKKCFFTYATGKKYLNFAFALARSYRFHNGINIPFYIISDRAFSLPSDLKWVLKKIVSTDEIGSGLEFKLSFDHLPDTDEAIFIDADSIIYGNISSLFEEIKNDSVRVIGTTISDGNWVDLEVAETLKKYNLPYLIRYCGAFYYIAKGNLSKDVYHFAKKLLNEKDSFHQHVFGVNEEPLMSIALSKFSIVPYSDDGNIWTDLVQWTTAEELNVFTGRPSFKNDSLREDFKFWLPDADYLPLIIHMGGGNYNKNPWLFEALRLKLLFKYKLSANQADWLITRFIKPSYFLLKKLKNKIEKRGKN